jgi:hypothetical protein
MGGQAIEIFRRSREQNPNLAGLTPFTILFHNWHGISRFEDMKPKPLGAQYGVSYQPVLLSLGVVDATGVRGLARSGPVAHVVNDDEQFRDLKGLKVRWVIVDSSGNHRAQASVNFPDVKYYAAKSKPVPFDVPANLPTGKYTLVGVLSNADSVLVDELRQPVHCRQRLQEARWPGSRDR